MARRQKLPPRAASLTDSMRDLGYTLETAVADIIDNSIAANATEVTVFLYKDDENPVAAVLDNGEGMTENALVAAMRHGATSPKDSRKPGDLGRFGLGLKTASLSQCRQLTVVSIRDDAMCGAQWDLDLVEECDDWVISVLEDGDFEALPFVSEFPGGNGTLVIWQKLDRLSEGQRAADLEKLIDEKLATLRHHLSLVFHRYLSGEISGRRPLSIKVNGHSLSPFDPFCTANPATQPMPLERINVNGSEVAFTPFILPHHSRLSKSDYEFYRTKSEFLTNQGAYVYRLGRLMAWGDWFRLMPKGEATKLARVRIDFTPALDTQWTIDIKKSRAYPPPLVRERLKEVLQRVVHRSTRVHRGRGERLFEQVKHPMWLRTVVRGGIHYTVNPEHPLVALLKKTISVQSERHLELLLSAIATALPIEMIYADFSSSPKEVIQDCDQESDLLQMIRDLRRGLAELGIVDADEVRDVISALRLSENRDAVIDSALAEEL